MNLRLDKLIPLPLLEQNLPSSEVWEARDYRFEGGKTYIVEAPSGKGKTSLLSILYGLRKDYRGRVFHDTRNIAEFSSAEWSLIRKEKISFIFQGLELFEELDALDNILLKNRISDFRSGEEIRQMAQMLGIDKQLNKKAGILSYGQKQRVAILRALCQPFHFLLADECFSHIDRTNSKLAFELITEACSRQGAGLILTSLDNSPELSVEERIKL